MFVIHTLGKTGSRSVYHGARGLRLPSRHEHALSQVALAQRRFLRTECATTEFGQSDLRAQTADQHGFMSLMRDRLLERQYAPRFLSMTRDPLAQFVSAVFQNLRDVLGPTWRRRPPTDPLDGGPPPDATRVGFADIERLLHAETRRLADLRARHAALNLRFSWTSPLIARQDPVTRLLAMLALSAETWFDLECRPYFQIDVLGTPFDPELGYRWYEGPRGPHLVLRQERLRSLGPELVAKLLDIEAFPIPVRNVGAKREAVGPLYRQALRHLRLDPRFVEDLYATRYARHFHAPEEIQAGLARWSL